MNPLTNAYLYAAARAQTLQTIVKPALERGDIVISDRCFVSSCVIQGEAQWLGINTVLWVNKSAVGKLMPNIILYLDIDIDTALSRTFDEGGDKFEKEGRAFYCEKNSSRLWEDFEVEKARREIRENWCEWKWRSGFSRISTGAPS